MLRIRLSPARELRATTTTPKGGNVSVAIAIWSASGGGREIAIPVSDLPAFRRAVAQVCRQFGGRKSPRPSPAGQDEDDDAS